MACGSIDFSFSFLIAPVWMSIYASMAYRMAEDLLFLQVWFNYDKTAKEYQCIIEKERADCCRFQIKNKIENFFEILC